MSKPLVSIVMGSDSDFDIMREGAKALENFEQLARTVLQSPKPSILKNPKEKTSSRKPKNSDKD